MVLNALGYIGFKVKYHHHHQYRHYHNCRHCHHHHADLEGDCYKWWLERILVDPGEKPRRRPSVQILRGVVQRVNWPILGRIYQSVVKGFIGFKHWGPWIEMLSQTISWNPWERPTERICQLLLSHWFLFFGGETFWVILLPITTNLLMNRQKQKCIFDNPGR